MHPNEVPSEQRQAALARPSNTHGKNEMKSFFLDNEKRKLLKKYLFCLLYHKNKQTVDINIKFLTFICSTSRGTVSPFRMDSVADVMSLKNAQI